MADQCLQRGGFEAGTRVRTVIVAAVAALGRKSSHAAAVHNLHHTSHPHTAL